MDQNWNHDLMLSIHSYYVGEFSTGIRASERILNSEAPGNIKGNAAQNLSFYAKTLGEEFDTEYTRIETSLVQDGWTLFNPTIHQHENGFLVLARSSNYFVDEKANYIVRDDDNNVFKTNYYQLLLDSNLKIKSVSTVKLPLYEKTNFTVDGLEDFRLFYSKNSYWVSGTIRNMQPYDSNCRIAVCKFDPSIPEVFSPKVIETDVQYEKNWMPLINSEKPMWLHHPNLNDKTSIIWDDGTDYQLKLIDCKFNYANYFRGGTQLFPLNGKYYSLVHLVTLNENQRRIYYHRFVEWDSDLSLIRYSKPFYLKEKRVIEFAAGLTIKNNMVHISFGIDDKEAWIATISVDNMLSTFFLDGKAV